MLDEAEIRKEIARLEYEESSYPNYAKLADLYTISDRMSGGTRRTRIESGYSGVAMPTPATAPLVGEYGDSDFLKNIAGKEPSQAWGIMDELMDTLALVNKKVYDSVLQKIKRI